jgi:protein-S-isoprenylcysteine O-methyltransferase Ste14
MLVVIVLWVLFFFTHSLLASHRAKEHAGQWLGSYFRFYRLGYNIFSVIFLGGILSLLIFSDSQDYVFFPTTLSVFAGSSLMGLGLVIMVLSFRNYDLSEFSGIRQLAQKIHHPEKLMVTGLNVYVRNPLYTGTIVFMAGYFLWQPTSMYLVTLIIMYIYIYIGTLLEERKLEEVFGEEYRAYKRKVKMLIPFLF